MFIMDIIYKVLTTNSLGQIKINEDFIPFFD